MNKDYKQGYSQAQHDLFIEEKEFLNKCFLDKKLIFCIDRIAERLDGDELVLIHKLIDMANEQNKLVIERIDKLEKLKDD